MPQDTNTIRRLRTPRGRHTMVSPGKTNGTGFQEYRSRQIACSSPRRLPSSRATPTATPTSTSATTATTDPVFPVGANWRRLPSLDRRKRILLANASAVSTDGQLDYYRISVAPMPTPAPRPPRRSTFTSSRPMRPALAEPGARGAAVVQLLLAAGPGSEYLTLGTPDANGQPAKAVSTCACWSCLATPRRRPTRPTRATRSRSPTCATSVADRLHGRAEARRRAPDHRPQQPRPRRRLAERHRLPPASRS